MEDTSVVSNKEEVSAADLNEKPLLSRTPPESPCSQAESASNSEEPLFLGLRSDSAGSVENLPVGGSSTSGQGRLRRIRRKHAYNTRPSEKLTAALFLTVRGVENVFIYVWIAKDLAWTQSWYYASWIFGVLALVISFAALLRSVVQRPRPNFEDVWHRIAQFCWLSANFVWMVGDVHDTYYRNARPIYDEWQHVSQRLMEGGLVFIASWYFIVLPLGLLRSRDQGLRDVYDELGLTCRLRAIFPEMHIFQTWSSYESLHIVLWMLKDYAWNAELKWLWLLATPPTVLIGIDFVVTTAVAENMIVDHAHYISQFLWVIANLVWAGGELYGFYDDPVSLVNGNDEALDSPRYWSSLLLLGAYIPILILYCVWIYMTCAGKIPNKFEAAHSPRLLKSSNEGCRSNFDNVRQTEDEISQTAGTSVPNTTNMMFHSAENYNGSFSIPLQCDSCASPDPQKALPTPENSKGNL